MTREKVNILFVRYAVFVFFCSEILSKYPSVNLLQEPRKEGKEESGVWQILRSFWSFDYVNGFIVYHDLVSYGLFYYAPSISRYKQSKFNWSCYNNFKTFSVECMVSTIWGCLVTEPFSNVVTRRSAKRF